MERDAVGDEVRVTVIAAGFDGGAPVRRIEQPQTAAGRGPIGTASSGEIGRAPIGTPRESVPAHAAPEPREPRTETGPGTLPPIPVSNPPRPAPAAEDEGDDDVDVPIFMRR